MLPKRKDGSVNLSFCIRSDFEYCGWVCCGSSEPDHPLSPFQHLHNRRTEYEIRPMVYSGFDYQELPAQTVVQQNYDWTQEAQRSARIAMQQEYNRLLAQQLQAVYGTPGRFTVARLDEAMTTARPMFFPIVEWN
jgi:hypothetical protein